MATHSSILAWKIPWTEEPVGLQPMGSQRETTEHSLSLVPTTVNINVDEFTLLFSLISQYLQIYNMI